MRPEEVGQWQRIVRDLATLAVGVFILIYETVGAAQPNEWLIGAGLTALGLVPLFRYDEAVRNGKNGKSGKPPSRRADDDAA